VTKTISDFRFAICDYPIIHRKSAIVHVVNSKRFKIAARRKRRGAEINQKSKKTIFGDHHRNAALAIRPWLISYHSSPNRGACAFAGATQQAHNQTYF
jgi:hypothetical protein